MTKIRILIADDETHIHNKITKIIESNHEHYEVVNTVKNGLEALAYVKKNPIDLIITDIKMPEMSGIEFISEIRDQYPLIKVIFITGYEEFEYAKKAIRLNASDFLLKPIKASELNRILNELIIEFDKEKEIDFGIGLSNQTSIENNVNLIKKYLQENYLQNISINEIAKMLGFSQAYLTNIYMKIEKTTPSKYQLDLRMNAAKKYLKDPSLNIAEIAELLNYSDQFAFSKAFKKHEQVSPMQYRKKHL